MAISRVTTKPARTAPRLVLVRWTFSLILFVAPLVSACTSVRPVIKIGLLASFEGLQRRSGYEALAVMRMALDEVAQADRAVIPLAMNAGADGAEAQRAVRKMLRDPEVKAVVGPYDPELIEAIRPIMAERQIPWFLPFELDPAVGMASAVAPSRWAQALLDAVATAARQQGHDRLVLAGDSAGWPPEEELAKMETPLPVALLNGATADLLNTSVLNERDALFWLGDPASGAEYFETIRQAHPEISFWLGPWGSDPIFRERTTAPRFVYWVSWIDDGYKAWQQAATRHGIPDSPAAYLTFRATVAALVTVDLLPPAPTAHWQLQTFAIQEDGTSQPVQDSP